MKPDTTIPRNITVANIMLTPAIICMALTGGILAGSWLLIVGGLIFGMLVHAAIHPEGPRPLPKVHHLPPTVYLRLRRSNSDTYLNYSYLTVEYTVELPWLDVYVKTRWPGWSIDSIVNKPPDWGKPVPPPCTLQYDSNPRRNT